MKYEDSLESYNVTCGTVNALISECDVVGVIVAGNFNCNDNSRFKTNFSKLCTVNKLICSDNMRLDKAFTFCGDNENVVSWIDHILCSVAIDNTISHIEVLYHIVRS